MSNDYILADDGELYHYGVLGMKWGIRRYQNKDGTLTAAGKRRQRKELAESVMQNVKYHTYNRNGKPYTVLDGDQDKVQNIPAIKEACKKLSTTRDAYIKSLKPAAKFNEDNVALEKYSEIAFKAYNKRNSIIDAEYYDWEDAAGLTGKDSAFSYWCKDNGINYDSYRKEVSNAKKAYDAECESLTRELISGYGYKRLKTSSKYKPTVEKVVREALDRELNRERLNNALYWPEMDDDLYR